MTGIGYHSVHLEAEPAQPREAWADGRSMAFRHEIRKGPLPKAFADCDVLYADLPWRSGHSRYLDRAEVPSSCPGVNAWQRFMGGVAASITAWQKPAVLVTGIHARRYLPPAGQELAVRMPVAGRQAAIAYIYNAGFTPDWDGTDGLVDYLAARFGRVGDFCAGYGWAPRAFTRVGGTFVASDINPRCIGYIAAHATEWAPK